MFGSIGGFELLVLLAIGLLVFGPRRLPELGRSLAKGLNELRRAAGEIRESIEKEADLGPVRQVAGDLKQSLQKEAGKIWRGLDEDVAATQAPPPAPATTEKREETKVEPGGPAAP